MPRIAEITRTGNYMFRVTSVGDRYMTATGNVVIGNYVGTNAAGTGGRLNVNIISSDMPGEKLASGPRYRRATEVMKIVRTLLNGEHLDHKGEFYQLELDPARISTISGKCPAFYFGGLSDEARECAAEGCDRTTSLHAHHRLAELQQEIGRAHV